MRYSTTLALATAGVLAVGLSGCASGGDGAADSAPAATSAAPVELTQASFVEQLSTAQTEAETVHLTMSYSGAAAEAAGLVGAPLEADVNIADPENPAMAMRMDVEGETADMVLVDGDFYMNMGETTSGKYLSMAEAAESDNPMAGLFQGMGDLMQSSLQDMDPAAQLEGMEGAITSFEKSGAETVDGVETDVYTMLVDPTKMTGPQVEDLPDEVLSKMGEMEIVYKVGADNLARAMEMTMDVEGQPLVTSGTFTGWGEPVEIAAPAAGELISLDELMGSMAG